MRKQTERIGKPSDSSAVLSPSTVGIPCLHATRLADAPRTGVKGKSSTGESVDLVAVFCCSTAWRLPSRLTVFHQQSGKWWGLVVDFNTSRKALGYSGFAHAHPGPIYRIAKRSFRGVPLCLFRLAAGLCRERLLRTITLTDVTSGRVICLAYALRNCDNFL